MQRFTGALLLSVAVTAVLGATGCGGAARPKAPVAPELSPSIDAVLLASEVSPEESLSVRLLGTIGPSGAYALRDASVSIVKRDVYIVPTVTRATDGNFIQMVMPLDHTVRVRLGEGRWTVRVLTTEEQLRHEVFVARNARTIRPKTLIEVGGPYQQREGNNVSVQVRGEITEGYVDRIEVREVVDGKAGAWFPAQEVRREGAALVCTTVVQRRQGAKVVLEARSLSGQGYADRTPATLTLE